MKTFGIPQVGPLFLPSASGTVLHGPLDLCHSQSHADGSRARQRARSGITLALEVVHSTAQHTWRPQPFRELRFP